MALKKTLLDEPKYDKQCPWNDHGYRCQENGWISESVNGGGPWYCRAHFADLKKQPRFKVPVDDQSQLAIDTRAARFVPMLDDETEHEWSMRCKGWVLSRIGKPKAVVVEHDLEEAA